MKKALLVITFFLLIFSCRKDHDLPPEEVTTLPSYIKKLLRTDRNAPYEGNYYIDVNFTNRTTAETRTLHFDENNVCMAFRYDSSHEGTGVSEQTVMFVSAPLGEHLEISFYYDLATDTAFRLCCADYLYADPWKGVPGANVQYAVPVSNSGKKGMYIYRGTDGEDSYFKVIYRSNERVNGKFHTTWRECCGEPSSYDGSGDFSIPVFSNYWWLQKDVKTYNYE